jgi:glycosyltransferase involved in cell wall biosynthesis
LNSIDFSVVICTKNRPHKIGAAVSSVLQAIQGLPARVIIVDQSTDRQTAAVILALQDERVRYEHVAVRNLSQARNHGIRLAQSEIIAFTDDDCLVDREWARTIRQQFDQRSDAAAVFGKTLAYQPDLAAVITYNTHCSPFGQSAHAVLNETYYCHSLTTGDVPAAHNRPCTPSENVGSSNNFAVRRQTFVESGLFAERLGAGTWINGAEDCELVYRWLRQGRTLLYAPSVLAFHDNWLDSRAERTLLAQYAIGGVAVFSYFALKGDALARNVLRYRWRGIVDSHRTKGKAKSSMYSKEPPPATFIRGVIGGIYLWLRGPGYPALNIHDKGYQGPEHEHTTRRQRIPAK